MTDLVHITTAGNAERIARGGVRSGGYAMPVLPSYPLTHQWVRELRRWRPGVLVAVDLRLPDDTPVTVGHYGRPQSSTTVAAAAALIRSLDDPRGYQIRVPDAIPAASVRRVRHVPQGVGWRYRPSAHGRRPCPCPACLAPGTPLVSRLRRRGRDGKPRRTKPELMTDLRRATTTDDIVAALWSLAARRRGGAEELAYLADHPDPEVREALSETLTSYRGPAARQLRARLSPTTPADPATP